MCGQWSEFDERRWFWPLGFCVWWFVSWCRGFRRAVTKEGSSVVVAVLLCGRKVS